MGERGAGGVAGWRVHLEARRVVGSKGGGDLGAQREGGLGDEHEVELSRWHGLLQGRRQEHITLVLRGRVCRLKVRQDEDHGRAGGPSPGKETQMNDR